jgi:hypothetical protein
MVAGYKGFILMIANYLQISGKKVLTSGGIGFILSTELSNTQESE